MVNVLSGTTDFNLSNADIVLEAYSRCGIQPTALDKENLISGYRSLNLELQSLANFVPNLWKIETLTIDLVEGQTTYDIPPAVMVMLDVYIRNTDTVDFPNDRILMPISRTDYAMIPNKNSEGMPTSFWFDRLLEPTVTLWQVPDGNGPYTLLYTAMLRIQDSNVSMGQTSDIPIRYLEALCARVAARLAEKYAPDKEDKLIMKAEARLKEAQTEDRERTPIYISPDVSGYYQIG